MSNPTEEQLKWELKRALEEIERLKQLLDDQADAHIEREIAHEMDA